MSLSRDKALSWYCEGWLCTIFTRFEGWGKKHVSEVLKANGYTKTFLRNFPKPVTTSSTPDVRGNQRLVSSLFPTSKMLRNPARQFWIATTLKLLKNLSRLWDIFLPNLWILSRKKNRTDAIYSIPCNDCDNEYIGQTKRQFGTCLKEHQKAAFFCKKKIQLYRSTQP